MSQTIIPKDAETARALLQAAEVAGLDPMVVESTFDGFVVPDEVADIFHHGGVKPEPKKAAPKKKAATSSRSRTSATKE